jgi:iron complex outermembrane receptor protein
MSTNEFNSKAYTEFNNSIGSFNTIKNTIKVGTGLIGNHFIVDARISKITSDGFIDRAASDLKSFYISAAYFNKNHQLD